MHADRLCGSCALLDETGAEPCCLELLIPLNSHPAKRAKACMRRGLKKTPSSAHGCIDCKQTDGHTADCALSFGPAFAQRADEVEVK